MTTQTERRHLVPDKEPPVEALKRLLAEDDRNLSWLAKKTGLSLSHLFRVVGGERPISADLARKLAELFGEPVGTFLGDGE